LFAHEKAGLRRLFSRLRSQLTSCRRLQEQRAQAQVQQERQQADQQQEPRRVQRRVQPEPMRFQELFHRTQPKRGSTELQSEQNDS